MRKNQFMFALGVLVFLLPIVCWRQKSAMATNVETAAESLTKVTQAPELPGISAKCAFDAKNLLPRIFFDETVCDLGKVGQGTKNSCEFRFTNTGKGLLKIGNISRTCVWRR